MNTFQPISSSPPPSPAPPVVAVLMATFNGEKYLREQIDSVLSQQGVTVRILVSDDQSTDSTPHILDEYKGQGLLDWFTGPHLGVERNYLGLMRHAPTADLYACCDQDDVWLPDKLAAAVAHLRTLDLAKPAIYYSSLELVDEQLQHLSTHRVCHSRSDFAKFVFGGIAGCTMVFNRRLLDEANRLSPTFLRMHDSWLLDVCLALGGACVTDIEPHIRYRQHGSNVVGIKKGSWGASYRRYVTEANVAAHMQSLLDGCADRMVPAYRALATDLVRCNHSLPACLRLLFSPKIRFGNFGLQALFMLKAIQRKM